jgi:lipopolysaccharide export LptBFGC system permease protein LptF
MDFNTTTAHATPDAATMELLTYAKLAHTLQTVAMAALAFALFTYVPRLTQRIQLAKLPVFTGPGGPKSHMDSARIIYSEGYQKV